MIGTCVSGMMEASAELTPMKFMRLFRKCVDRSGLIGILFCFVSYAVVAQAPTKKEHQLLNHTDSETQPAPAALAATESELRHEIQLHPDSAEILYKLGLVLRQENRPKESLEIYTQAAHLQKPNAEQLRSVALDYVVLEDYKDAIHWLEVAVSLDPRNADVLYSLGRCFYSQDRFNEAEAMYLRVLGIVPQHLKAEENLGLTYDMEDQPEKAEAALRAAAAWAAQQPSDEWPFLNLGIFLLEHDRAAEAVAFLQSAVTVSAGSAACHEKLGRALAESGKVSDGVKELETAVQLDPKNPKIHFELGHVYRQAGSIEKSRAEFALSQTLYGEHSLQ
jgi:Flp pilus assembly protein TadD